MESSIQCEEILASKSQELLGVLGLDCEWVSQPGERGSRKGEEQEIRSGGERENNSGGGGGGRGGDRYLVALLQLAFLDGHCVLVRLCKIGATLPPTLSILLQDNKYDFAGSTCWTIICILIHLNRTGSRSNSNIDVTDHK